MNQAISLAAKLTPCSFPKRILWFILYKSSWRSTCIRPLPRVFIILSLRKDINKSVVWLFWNSGWYLYEILFLVWKWFPWSNATLSIIFEVTCKISIDLYYSRLFFEVFLYNGLNFAIFQSLRKILAKIARM